MIRVRRTFVLALAPVLLLAGCRGTLKLERSDADTVLGRHALDVEDPSTEGPHEVAFLYYGSGTDRQRAVYRDSVSIVTPTVDASKLVDLGDDASSRNDYWGFSPDSFPLNARVWYPEGAGRHPLVLVVHGNHSMKEYSDPGYGYLGRLLASRGYIVASVDQNFINGAIDQENDGRGWLLLEHLKQWERFDAEEGNPFHGRVDLERIALVGHSRGGEAVANAAAFNRLERYPDDATLTFDYGFDIRSVVAIAPVDGQYRPTDRLVPFRDVNYMVFHGSHDGDVTSFHGLRPYDRLRFTDGASRFKTAIYVYRANHGQWNTVWGPHDNGPRSPRILDLRGLMPGEDQRRFARVYVSAFLDATVLGRDRYLPLFRDHRVAGDWLPPTMYVTELEHSSFRALARFEEDIDVTTGTAPGVRIRGEGLATWREDRLQLRSSNRPTTSSSQDNQGVWVGWNRRVAGSDTLAPPPSYRIRLPPRLGERWGLTGSTVLGLRLAPIHDVPPPGGAGGEDADSGPEPPPGLSDPEAPAVDEEPLELTLEVEDAEGRTAAVALSRYGPIRRPLEMSILRRKDLEEERFASLYELVLQSFRVPLSDFTAETPELDPTRLREVRLVFDRTEAGTVVVDDVGFSWMEPAFLRARVDAPDR